MLNSLSGLFTKKTRPLYQEGKPANQARLDELEREIDSLKATIARIGTPPNSFSTKNAFVNEVDNQESFARKFRRAGVATASSIQFGEVLPALKTKKALMSSSAQVSLRQAVLASPLFAGVQKSVEAIIHRFKPYDYESGETVTREDSPPCYVIVENGTFFHVGEQNRTYTEGDTFGELSVLFLSSFGSKVVCTSPGRCWVIDAKTVKLLQRHHGATLATKSLVQSTLSSNARLFGNLTDAQREAIMSSAKLATFRAEQNMCVVGEEIRHISLIVDGIAKLCAGDDVTLDVTAGDAIGVEAALLHDLRRPHFSVMHCIAQSEVKVLQLQCDQILGTSFLQSAQMMCKYYILSISRPLGLLTYKERLALANEISVRSYSDGWQITRQGQSGDAALILLHGEMEVKTIHTRNLVHPTHNSPSPLCNRFEMNVASVLESALN